MAPEMSSPPRSEQEWQASGRAFFVYYVAIALCGLGPLINPEVGLPPWLGLALAVVLVAVVLYRKGGQEYQATSRGVRVVWRWPQRQEEIPWEDLGDIQLKRGLTQTLLNVGNLFITDKAGQKQLLWYGLADPKGVKAALEARRLSPARP